jgi:hypothetical protein
MALIAAWTQSGRKAGFRLLKPPGKRLVSTGASLKPELRRSHRRIKGRRVFLPLAAQPVFDLRAGRQEAALQFEQRPGQGGGEVGNHAVKAVS